MNLTTLGTIFRDLETGYLIQRVNYCEECKVENTTARSLHLDIWLTATGETFQLEK